MNKSAASSGKIGTAASFMLLQMGRTRLVQRTGCGGRLGGLQGNDFPSFACVYVLWAFFFAGLTVVGLHCGEEAECKRVACHQFVGAGLRSHCQRRCRASPRNLRKNFSWYQKQGVNIGRFVTSICWDDTDSGRIVCKNLGMRFRRDMRHQQAAILRQSETCRDRAVREWISGEVHFSGLLCSWSAALFHCFWTSVLWRLVREARPHVIFNQAVQLIQS